MYVAEIKCRQLLEMGNWRSIAWCDSYHVVRSRPAARSMRRCRQDRPVGLIGERGTASATRRRWIMSGARFLDSMHLHCGTLVALRLHRSPMKRGLTYVIVAATSCVAGCATSSQPSQAAAAPTVACDAPVRVSRAAWTIEGFGGKGDPQLMMTKRQPVRACTTPGGSARGRATLAVQQ
jgi:hypothetical protein